MVTNMDPYLKWTLAVIAGGGVAGLVQSATVLTRGASSVFTGGLGNPLLATAELGGSLATTSLAFIAPAFVVTAVVVLLIIVGWKFWGREAKPRPTALIT
jgi:hypothetical protein